MSTVAYSQQGFEPAASTEKPARLPFWRRAYEAMIASRQRRAEREVAAYIASRGGSLTDEVERDIMRNLAKGAPFSRG